MLSAALALALALVAPQVHQPKCHASTDPRCPIYGDVTGDGQTDRVRVRRLTPCRFRLVVRTKAGSRTQSSPLRPFCGKPSEVWPQGFPRVVALRPMNTL